MNQTMEHLIRFQAVMRMLEARSLEVNHRIKRENRKGYKENWQLICKKKLLQPSNKLLEFSMYL